jgi:hypothetical protein
VDQPELVSFIETVAELKQGREQHQPWEHEWVESADVDETGWR